MSYFFTVNELDGCEVLVPGSMALSRWGGQLRGLAISGALARSVVRSLATDDDAEFQAARWTVDLLAPVADAPLTTEVHKVKHGHRTRLTTAEAWQAGRVVARASALHLRRGGVTRGQAWVPSAPPVAPPKTLATESREQRLYFSETAGWTAGPDAHQNAERKQTWHLPVAIVEGEVPTPFELVAAQADVTSLVVNWGTEGLEYINVDLSLHLSRLPSADGFGLSALSRAESNGVAVGTAVVFDSAGVVGQCSISAVANGQAGVDPRMVDSLTIPAQT